MASVKRMQGFVANEDVGAATVLEAATGKVLTFVPVTREPEGVGISPTRNFSTSAAKPPAMFLPLTRGLTKSSRTSRCIRVPAAWHFPGRLARVVPSESAGELNVIDATNQTVLKVISLPKGSRPQCVKVSPDGKKVYASTGRAGTVCVVDANTYEVLNTINVGTRPWGIAISPDGKYLFAANGPSDNVSVVDLATEKEIARVKSPGSPWGVEVVPDGK